MKTFIWTTKDEQKLKVKDMDTSHIENCLKMLRKNLENQPPFVAYDGNNDNVEDAVNWASWQTEDVADDRKDWIDIFKRELKRRSI